MTLDQEDSSPFLSSVGMNDRLVLWKFCDHDGKNEWITLGETTHTFYRTWDTPHTECRTYERMKWAVERCNGDTSLKVIGENLAFSIHAATLLDIPPGDSDKWTEFSKKDENPKGILDCEWGRDLALAFLRILGVPEAALGESFAWQTYDTNADAPHYYSDASAQEDPSGVSPPVTTTGELRFNLGAPADPLWNPGEALMTIVESNTKYYTSVKPYGAGVNGTGDSEATKHKSALYQVIRRTTGANLQYWVIGGPYGSVDPANPAGHLVPAPPP